MDQSTKINETNKNKYRQEKNRKRKALKATSTKTYIKQEGKDDSKSVFSDLTFKITDSPDRIQSHSTLATTSILEDPNTEDIFAATGTRMQVSSASTSSAINKITIQI